MDFLSDNGGDTYNLCHCKLASTNFSHSHLNCAFLDWSNFEIADMDFWRGEAYQKFFAFLESKGGFYYEVRQLAILLFLLELLTFCSDGAMHPCIVLLHLYSLDEIKSTFSAT
jgi:hypothetical protein